MKLPPVCDRATGFGICPAESNPPSLIHIPLFFFKKKSLFFSHAIQIDIGNFKVFSTIEEKALALLWMPIKVPQGYLSLQFMGGIGTQLLIQTDYSSPPSTPSSALPTPLSPRSTPPPYPFITEQIS